MGAGGFEVMYTCGEPDPCLFPAPVDCGRRGVCSAGECLCLDGYTGEDCDIEPDQCVYPTVLECGNHGHCTAGRCICDPGFEGAFCEVRPDPCQWDFVNHVEAEFDCGPHGQCISMTWGSAVCDCQDGWTGGRCQEQPPPTLIDTDGGRIVSDITVAGDQKWFAFNATHGRTYQIATELIGLADTVMLLYQPDQTTLIAENDDSDVGRNSNLEWTCPRDGIYFVLVHSYDMSQTGDFRFSIELQGDGNDPCVDGAQLDTDSGVVSFMPDGNYKDDSLCEWVVSCDNAHDQVSMEFLRLDTELDYDTVTLFDGSKSFDPVIQELSGTLDDLEATTFASTGREMLVSFSTDESVSGLGFEVSYSCSGASSSQQDATLTNVVPDTGPVIIDLDVPGEQAWFVFDAQVGSTYELVTRLHGLPDTVMHLYDSDRERQLAENDDYSTGRDSYLEWTCPATASYYVMVTAYDSTQTGDFEFEVTTQSVEGGEGDACTMGARLTEPSAVISNYVIDGQYEDDGLCDWTIDCGDLGPVVLDITRLETEVDYDIVSIYDGEESGDNYLMAELSGLLRDQQQTNFESSGTSLLLEFTTDESVGGPGFQAAYHCGNEEQGTTADREIVPVAVGLEPQLYELTAAGQQIWFMFPAVAGHVYELTVLLVAGGITDSVLHLFDTDMQRQIAENDDYDAGLNSYLEWSCPADGNYFAAVHGYESQLGAFRFSVAEVGASSDPCAGTMSLTRASASVSFMDGNYEHDSQCDWLIECPEQGDLVSLSFTRFDTELDYDEVAVFDGGTSDDQILGALSGRMDQLSQTSFTSTGQSLLIEFTSDESEAGPGFEASYTCGQADLCTFPEIVRCGEHGECDAGTCICLDGFSGTHCQIQPDQCIYPEPVDCGHHGDCSAGACQCRDGYTGSRCEVRPDPCMYPEPVECGRHGTCASLPNGVAYCACEDEYEGEHCEMVLQPPEVPTDGRALPSTIATGGELKRFALRANEGAVYLLATHLFGLPDTVMHLYDKDGTTEIAENDDAVDGRNSEIEWTCPSTGTYFIVVHAFAPTQMGDFTLTAEEALLGAEDDPCTADIDHPVTLTAQAAVVSFLPVRPQSQPWTSWCSSFDVDHRLMEPLWVRFCRNSR